MKNKYQILSVVGEGSYGIVYKAQNKITGEIVAIKRFKEANEEIVKKTMSRELRILQIVNHENVVKYIEAFKRKGSLFIVFEYVEKNLLEVLQESANSNDEFGLHELLIKRLIYQLITAVTYLHSLNIIHRDIKPENLLINIKETIDDISGKSPFDNFNLKLCDFGFARRAAMKALNEGMTDYVATRWYRAPELICGNGYYGLESDFWAIGCIFGELIDGDPLFPGDDQIDQLYKIQQILGKFPEDFINKYSFPLNNMGQKNLDFDVEIDQNDTLEKRYSKKLSPLGLEFLKELLQIEPEKRPNSNSLLYHEYFKGFYKDKNDFNRNARKISNQGINVSGHNFFIQNGRESRSNEYSPGKNVQHLFTQSSAFSSSNSLMMSSDVVSQNSKLKPFISNESNYYASRPLKFIMNGLKSKSVLPKHKIKVLKNNIKISEKFHTSNLFKSSDKSEMDVKENIPEIKLMQYKHSDLKINMKSLNENYNKLSKYSKQTVILPKI
jgi:cyclin-dependent kinase-like